MASTISWHFAPFSVLTAAQLHGMLALRADVFVVEQHCPYADPDAKDPPSHHLWAEDETGAVLAVARVVPPGTSYAEPSIGRVATAASVRRTGLGLELMERALLHCRELYPNAEVVISAQHYLERFYRSLGFVPEGGIYDEDGIPHIQMRKSSN